MTDVVVGAEETPWPWRRQQHRSCATTSSTQAQMKMALSSEEKFGALKCFLLSLQMLLIPKILMGLLILLCFKKEFQTSIEKLTVNGQVMNSIKSGSKNKVL